MMIIQVLYVDVCEGWTTSSCQETTNEEILSKDNKQTRKGQF